MDPDTEQISRAQRTGAERIELYTGPFAATFSRYGGQDERTLASFRQYVAAAEHALALGLGVNAGHDLDVDNLELFRELPGLAEVSIGHALTARALFGGGLDATVREFLAVLAGAPAD